VFAWCATRDGDEAAVTRTASSPFAFWRSAMTIRTTTTSVTFQRPFNLIGFDQPQAAGIYEINTEEELLDSVRVAVWRRVSTTIALRDGVTTQYLSINPEDLYDAQARDAAPLVGG
jgi:hypothetical protein